MSKGKKLSSKNMHHTVNLLAPFVVYTLVDYWSLPIWLFAVWFTLWVIGTIGVIYLNVTRETVEL